VNFVKNSIQIPGVLILYHKLSFRFDYTWRVLLAEISIAFSQNPDKENSFFD